MCCKRLIALSTDKKNSALKGKDGLFCGHFYQAFYSKRPAKAPERADGKYLVWLIACIYFFVLFYHGLFKIIAMFLQFCLSMTVLN